MDFNPKKELVLRDLTAIYRRRRGVVYATVAVLFFGAAIYCIFGTRRYEATSTIQIQSKSTDKLGLQNMMDGSPENDTDSVGENINIQTQADILQSDTLALKIIEKLHMEGTKDFLPHWNPISWALGLISPSGVADTPNASLEDSPRRRRSVLGAFHRNLKVQPVNGTRLIQISYLNPDPRLAAEVVNDLTLGLIDFSFQARFDATNQAASWLSDQLGDLRQQSEEMERKVADLESKSGVYSLGQGAPDGQNQAYSDVLAKLQQATAAMSQAEQNRILRGAILHAVENGDAEMLSGLAGNSTTGSGMNNSLTVIQNLRGQEGIQQAALQQAEAKYGESYPKLEELRSNIAGLQRSIHQEIERLQGRARSDYDDAVRTEAETRTQYDTLKAQADTLNDKSVHIAILRQEANQSRDLYQDLLKKFKEAGVLEGLKGSAITVVDPGRVPDSPKKPNVPLTMAAALGVGFLFGCCLALLVDVMDSKIKTVDEVEWISGENLLGVTPFYSVKAAPSIGEGPPPLACLDDPQSPFIEAARVIRTEILLRSGAEPSKVILITSSVPGEGKTVLSANLAVLFAQSSKRVLLIDTDLRLGAINKVLNLPARAGLSQLLADHLQQPEIDRITAVPNLDVLQAGGTPDNPAELLGSSSFKSWLSAWREKYDYVVLDSAPLLPVADSLILAPLSDISLLIARPGLTEKSQLIRSYQLLTRGTKYSVGTVLNALRPEDEGYSSYFGYRKPVSKSGEIVKTAKWQ